LYPNTVIKVKSNGANRDGACDVYGDNLMPNRWPCVNRPLIAKDQL